jgi:hypothetical protein
MSGVVKGIKKVFKKVGKVIKKIAKPLIVAAAIYFTAGVALSYMGAASASFAASMPGFAAGGGMGGIFATAATNIGLGSGLAAGAAANAAAAGAAVGGTLGGGIAAGGVGGAGMMGPTVAAAGAPLGSTAGLLEGIGGVSTMGTSGLATATGGAISGTTAGAGVGAAANLAGASLAPGTAYKPLVDESIKTAAKLSFADKALLASTGLQAVSALTGPTPEETYEAEYAAQAKVRKSYYGMDPKGNTTPAPAMNYSSTQPTEGVPLAPTAVPPAGQVAASPEQQQLQAGRQKRMELFPTPGLDLAKEEAAPNPMLYGSGQMKQNIPVPSSVSGIAPTPGVRYV